MSSIVLNPGVKEMLLNDTRDFLKSEKVISYDVVAFLLADVAMCIVVC